MSTVASNNPSIVYQDSVTLVYKDIDGTWYLNDGTPIDDYDPNTGAYSEGGSWYTFQGVELKAYDKTTGNYQEPDGTWYTKDGVNLVDSGAGLAPSTGAVANPAKALNKAPKSKGLSLNAYIGIAIAVVVIVGIALYFIFRKK